MTSRSQWLPGLALALVCLSCGSSPTQPSTSSPAVAATIASLSVASPAASSVAQTLTVAGTNFASGLSVSLLRPDGSSLTISAPDIHDITGSAFQMNVMLNTPGAYSFTVTNVSAPVSGTMTVRAMKAPYVSQDVTVIMAGSQTLDFALSLVSAAVVEAFSPGGPPLFTLARAGHHPAAEGTRIAR